MLKYGLTLLVLIIVLPTVVVGYSYSIEPHWIETTPVTVQISDLPAEFDGLRIVQISDLHVGPYVSEPDIDKVVATVNQLNPDLVAITGDFISRPVNNIYPCARSLKALRARYGVYGILGNHDIDNQPDEITAELRSVNVKVLRNQSTSLTIGAQQLWLLGVDDLYLDQDDLPTAMANVSEGQPTILLCHSPDIAEEATLANIDLILCGHTHGGQVQFPLLGPLIIPLHNPQYLAGLFSLDHTQMYVNRGIGMVYPPIRFGARPEITVLTLRARD